jgi:hypothetical protein
MYQIQWNTNSTEKIRIFDTLKIFMIKIHICNELSDFFPNLVHTYTAGRVHMKKVFTRCVLPRYYGLYVVLLQTDVCDPPATERAEDTPPPLAT